MSAIGRMRGHAHVVTGDDELAETFPEVDAEDTVVTDKVVIDPRYPAILGILL